MNLPCPRLRPYGARLRRRGAPRLTRRPLPLVAWLAVWLAAPGYTPLGAEPLPPAGPPVPTAPDRRPLELGLEGEVSGIGGLEGYRAGARVEYGSWRLRVAVAGSLPPSAQASPRVGWTLTGPAGAAGAVEPSGLASFILRPHGLSYRLYLPSGLGRPLASAPPLEAGWIGAAAGADGGLFALEPAGSGTPSLTGAWVAPGGTGLSALMATARAPAEPADDTWYAAPLPPRDLRWLAAAAAFGSGPYRGAFALGAEGVSPGGDAYALRHESRLRLPPFGFELVASLAGSPSRRGAASVWLGPRLAEAPSAFAQATASYARRRAAAWLRYTGQLAPAWTAPRHGIDAGLGLAGPGISLQVRASFDPPAADAQAAGEPAAGEPAKIGAAARLGVGRSAAGASLRPVGFSAFGSWRAEGGRPVALELGAGLAYAFGARLPALRAEAAWRAAPTARSYRWRVELELPLGPTLKLAAFGRSPGWIAYELPGAMPASGAPPAIELGARVSAALALY